VKINPWALTQGFLTFGGGGENRTPVRKPSAVGTTCLVRSLNLIYVRLIDNPG